MLIWLMVVGVSIIVGFVAARLIEGSLAAWMAAVVAWLLLLAGLLIEVYVLPYRGGGARCGLLHNSLSVRLRLSWRRYLV